MPSETNIRFSQEEFSEHADEFQQMIRARYNERQVKMIEHGISGKMFLVAVAKILPALPEEAREPFFNVAKDFVQLTFTQFVKELYGEDVKDKDLMNNETKLADSVVNKFLEGTGIL
jgi:hypothetical protein